MLKGDTELTYAVIDHGLKKDKESAIIWWSG